MIPWGKATNYKLAGGRVISGCGLILNYGREELKLQSLIIILSNNCGWVLLFFKLFNGTLNIFFINGYGNINIFIKKKVKQTHKHCRDCSNYLTVLPYIGRKCFI